MQCIFMNSENSKTSEPHRIILNLTNKIDKIDLRRKDKYVALSNLSIYYIWKNVKESYKKKNISASTQNEEFKLPKES